MVDIITAIQAINPDAKVSINAEDFEQITWHEGTSEIPKADIEAKMAELQAEHDALAYARSRDIQYPSLKEFAEAYTEKEILADTAKWDEYVIKYNKVRTDNPKS